jgi:multicomponent Na+:H+ antiporter subunit G
MTFPNLLTVILLVIGGFFFMTGTLGLLRFPDFYSRMHATGKSDTLAVFCCLLALAIQHGLSLDSFKLLLIAVFVYVANPTGTHAICRAAFRTGVKPWTRKGKQ